MITLVEALLPIAAYMWLIMHPWRRNEAGAECGEMKILPVEFSVGG